MINTENAVISDSKDNQQITQLPLNNRATTTSPLAALTLSPNVQQDSSGNIAVGGASSAMVNFSVDDISTANMRQNGALQDAYPSQEGISAVTVTSFAMSPSPPRAARVSIRQPVRVSAKRRARCRPLRLQWQGAKTLQHLWRITRRPTEHSTSLQWEGQNVLLFRLRRKPPLDRSCPAVPCSHTGGARRQPGRARCPVDSEPISAIDQTINSKQSVYARFSRRNITEDYANPILPDDSDSVHNRSLLVSQTWVLTPRMINEFRFGFTNVTTSVGFPIEGADALSQLDLTGVNISQHPTTHAFPTFNFSTGTGFTPIGRDKTGVTQSKTMEFTNNLTWTRGKHTLKAGVDARGVRYADIETFLPSDDFGQFTFQPTFTGNAFGDFLEGLPTTIFFAVSSPDVAGTAWEYSVFGQDQYQISSASPPVTCQ